MTYASKKLPRKRRSKTATALVTDKKTTEKRRENRVSEIKAKTSGQRRKKMQEKRRKKWIQIQKKWMEERTYDGSFRAYNVHRRDEEMNSGRRDEEWLRVGGRGLQGSPNLQEGKGHGEGWLGNFQFLEWLFLWQYQIPVLATAGSDA